MTINIDGSKVKSITIDGITVQEVTIDGTVVFTADFSSSGISLDDYSNISGNASGARGGIEVKGKTAGRIWAGGSNRVMQFSLSSGSFISTSFESEIYIGDTEYLFSISWGPNGENLVAIGSQEEAVINVDTKYDISTGSVSYYSTNYAYGNTRGCDIFQDSDGNTGMLTVTRDTNKIFQYDLSINSSTGTNPSSSGSYNYEDDINNAVKGVSITNNGETVILNTSSTSPTSAVIAEYNLSTPYDISTASLESTTEVTTEYGSFTETDLNRLAVGEDGMKLYTLNDYASENEYYIGMYS